MTVHSRQVARVTAAALVAMLCGACGAGHREAVRDSHDATSAAPQQESRSPTPDGPVSLPWASAVVARDDTSITVTTGIERTGCRELSHPQARVTSQDDAQVVISVTANIVRAEDCSSAGTAAFALVALAKPLGHRVLRDAATSRPHPTYFQRDVPDLLADKRWDPVRGSQPWSDESWYQSYQQGPGGAEARIQAQPTAKAHRPATLATVQLGPRPGVITTDAAAHWVAWWEVGQVTYSLSLTPPEGRDLTLKQFEQQLAGFTWG